MRRSEGRREGKRKLWLEVSSCPAAAERKEPVCPALPRVPRVFGAGKDRPLHSDWSRGRLFRQGDHREQTGSQSRLLCCSLPLSFPRSLASLSRPRPLRQTTDGQSSILCAAWQMAHDVRPPVIPTRLFRPTARAPSSRSACGRPTGGQCLGGPSDRRGLIRPRGLLCRHSLMCITLCTFLGRQHGWTGEQ